MSDAAANNSPRSLGRPRSTASRTRANHLFLLLCLTTAFVSLVILTVLLGAIVAYGFSSLNWSFLVSAPSPKAVEAGIGPALGGTIWVCSVCALFTLPIGIGTAILLEEYKPTNRLLRWLHGLIQLNITNLAGVPSVVYGILGLTAFVSMFGLLGSTKAPLMEVGVRYYDQFLSEGDRVLLVPVAERTAPATRVEPGMKVRIGKYRLTPNLIGPAAPAPADSQTRAITLRTNATPGRINHKAWWCFQLPFGRGVLAGALTLMLVILPIVIISSQEAFRAVPNSLREAAYGMGATRWQVVWKVTLPAASPGVITGSILAMSRAIGEAAPILIICGIVYIASAPNHLMDDFAVMPMQIYNWAGRPQTEFHHKAAAGIIVLLAILLSFNGVAVFIRHKLQRPLS